MMMMKIGFRPAAAALVFLGLVTIAVPRWSAAQAGPPAGPDTETTAREVAAALKEYHWLFSSKRAADMARLGYGAPLMSLGRGNHTVWSTPRDVEAWADRFVTDLQASGWDRSDMPTPSICVLTPTSAIASGEFVRYRKDGSVLSRHGNAYVFSKGDAGWRVVAMFSHDANRPIRCDR